MTAKTLSRARVERASTPAVQARQAIAVFDSGSGGLVTASYLARIAAELDMDISVVFFGDTAHLPYGTRTQQDVARLSDGIIGRLATFAPVIGIACNTASASWDRFGRVGKDTSDPVVFSVVAVAAKLAYARAAVVPEPETRRRTKVIGVLGTDLTAEIQSHAEQIALLHRESLSQEIGYPLPLVPYVFEASGLVAELPPNTLDLKHSPHLALLREDEAGPGGTTRVMIRNWDPPEHLAHDVRVVARDAQHLVGDVDHHHVLDADGNLKTKWRDSVRDYLRETSEFLTRVHASSLILGCTHFEYFTREFDQLLPSLAARGGIVSPSGALAWELLSTYRDQIASMSVHPVTADRHTFAGFSGPTPPRATFRALGFEHITLYDSLTD